MWKVPLTIPLLRRGPRWGASCSSIRFSQRTFRSRVQLATIPIDRLSYYVANGLLGTTPGHRDVPGRDAEEALGVYYETFGPRPSIMRCFQIP